MSEDQKRQLESQLRGIANLLRGKISADDYRDYILGFIFFKYLSERQTIYANSLLEGEAVEDYKDLKDPALLEAISVESLQTLGYFLMPDHLFSAITAKGNSNTESESNYILEDLKSILNHIEQSTMGTASEEDLLIINKFLGPSQIKYMIYFTYFLLIIILSTLHLAGQLPTDSDQNYMFLTLQSFVAFVAFETIVKKWDLMKPWFEALKKFRDLFEEIKKHLLKEFSKTKTTNDSKNFMKNWRWTVSLLKS